MNPIHKIHHEFIITISLSFLLVEASLGPRAEIQYCGAQRDVFGLSAARCSADQHFWLGWTQGMNCKQMPGVVVDANHNHSH